MSRYADDFDFFPTISEFDRMREREYYEDQDARWAAAEDERQRYADECRDADEAEARDEWTGTQAEWDAYVAECEALDEAYEREQEEAAQARQEARERQQAEMEYYQDVARGIDRPTPWWLRDGQA